MHASRFFLVLVALAGLLVGCDDEAAVESGNAAPLSQWLPIGLEGVRLEVQVPLTRSEQARGLMHRESMDADRGMLFAYPAPQGMSFWMKNTLIPLDIGFFDGEGVLREIHRMYPRDRRSVRSRHQDLQYALEVNQGWFREHGITPGARLDREMLAAALRARGTDPSDFGL